MLQRCYGERAMHVGPGADADGVDLVVIQQFLPGIVHPGNVELVCHTLARLEAAVDHSNDLHPFDLAKTRDMTVADVATCTDKTDANVFVCHEKPPLRTTEPGVALRPSGHSLTGVRYR